ncbi:MAG: trypsin-like peptidase domain-containing protein [Dehalococcoidia bacterium]
MGSSGRLYIWLALLLAVVVVVVWACRTQGSSADLSEQLQQAEQQLVAQQAEVARLAAALADEETGASSLEEALSSEKEVGSHLSSLLAQALGKGRQLSQQIAELQARLGEPTPTPAPASTPTPAPSGTPIPPPSGTPTPTPTHPPAPVSDAVAQARQAVVLVKSSTAESSGFIFDQRGLVLTTAHAVGEDPWVTVITGDAVPLLGDVVGRHLPMDVAIIQLRTQSQMPALVLGDSSPASFEGDLVFLGYPRGSPLGQGATFTTGSFYAQRIASGISYLQIDASLTPGNSGGPLINSRGEAIGIYTARLFQPGAGHTQGAAFAIAMNPVKNAIPSLSAGMDITTAPPTTAPTRETLYRNVGWGYALRLPAGWVTDEGRLDSVLLWSTERMVGGEVFGRQATDYTVGSWTDFLLDAIQDRATDFEVLSRSPALLATGVPGISVLYTATFPSHEAPLKVRLVAAIAGNRNLALQVYAEESAWEEHSPQLETLAAGFIPSP